MTSFVPTPANQRAFRDALGQFATGVTVITAQTENGPIGITANSFSSLSLDPPLVLWSVAKTSDRCTHFQDAQDFNIHVLTAEQHDLAMAFAKSGDCFEDVPWAKNEKSVPVLPDCLSVFECSLAAQHDAGDHIILIGKVETVTMRDAKPLLFVTGKFGNFSPLD